MKIKLLSVAFKKATQSEYIKNQKPLRNRGQRRAVPIKFYNLLMPVGKLFSGLKLGENSLLGMCTCSPKGYGF